MHSSPEDLISTAEAAALIERHRSTITRWVEAGKLTPAFRSPAGFLLFRRSDVEALAAEVAA